MWKLDNFLRNYARFAILILMSSRIFDLHLVISGVRFTKVEIDDHYKEKHRDHMTDELILDLVKSINHLDLDPVKEYDDGLKIFVVEPLVLNRKPYRLVWFYYEGSHSITVRTAFRTRKKK